MKDWMLDMVYICSSWKNLIIVDKLEAFVKTALGKMRHAVKFTLPGSAFIWLAQTEN